MKNIQLPQITLDRLLELEVGESGHIIVPTNNKVMAIKGNVPCCLTLKGEPTPLINFSPLRQGDEFYIGEVHREYFTDDDIHSMGCAYSGEEYEEYPAKQMQPHQSRFHGTCLNVDVVKVSALECKEIEVEYFEDVIEQYNELYNTNITPSMDDYVFLAEVRRKNDEKLRN